MKMKNLVRFTALTVFIFFLVVYISNMMGYYETVNRKNILTEESIKKFEKDLKDGKEINTQKYIEKEKDYSNLFNKTGFAISNIIEKLFDKMMMKFFNEINEITK